MKSCLTWLLFCPISVEILAFENEGAKLRFFSSNPPEQGKEIWYGFYR
jgi:hypothetical protein